MNTEQLRASTDSMQRTQSELDGVVKDVESSVKTREDYTLPDIVTAAEAGDFAPISGTYCPHSGVCVRLDGDGTITVTTAYGDGSNTMEGVYSPLGDYGRTQSTLRSTVYEYSYANPTYVQGLGFPMSGPDSEYRCVYGSGKDTCLDAAKAETYSYPTSVTYYVAGAGSKMYDEANRDTYCEAPEQSIWPKDDVPFLMFPVRNIGAGGGCLVNQPTDNNVFYFESGETSDGSDEGTVKESSLLEPRSQLQTPAISRRHIG